VKVERLYPTVVIERKESLTHRRYEMPASNLIVWVAEACEEREPEEGQYQHSDHSYIIGIFDSMELAELACRIETEKKRETPGSNYSGRVRQLEVNNSPNWDIETLWRVFQSKK